MMDAAKCHSCGADVLWVRTLKGKRMPLDAEPTPKGNIVMGEGGLAFVYRDAAGIAPRLAGEPRYLSHFATCPQADEWRH